MTLYIIINIEIVGLLARKVYRYGTYLGNFRTSEYACVYMNRPNQDVRRT